jgi:hypothetical protein
VFQQLVACETHREPTDLREPSLPHVTLIGGHQFKTFVQVYAVTVGVLPRLSNAAEFWEVIQNHARDVARLPHGSGETIAVLLDYLSSEARIDVPLGRCTDIGTIIETPAGVDVVSCLSPRAAKSLRVSLAKRKILPQADPTTIFTAYDEKFANATDLCVQTLTLISNCGTHFLSDDERLLVLVIEDSMRDLRE